MAVIKEIDLLNPPKKGKIMPDRTIAIPGATLPPGKYHYGPYDVDADVDDLSMSIDVSMHRTPSVNINWRFFVSYDGSDPTPPSPTGIPSGSGDMRGGDLILDHVQTNFFPMTVGFDALQPKNRRKVVMEIEVQNGSVILGNSEVKTTKIATAVIGPVKVG